MVMVMSLRPANTRGEEILRIVDGHVREGADPNVRFESRTGQIEVIAPLTPEYVAEWAIEPLWSTGTPPAEVLLAGLIVVEPNVVRALGVFSQPDEGVFAITEDQLLFIRKGWELPSATP